MTITIYTAPQNHIKTKQHKWIMISSKTKKKSLKAIFTEKRSSEMLSMKQWNTESKKEIRCLPGESQRTRSESLPPPLLLYPSVHSSWKCPQGPAGLTSVHRWAAVTWKYLPFLEETWRSVKRDTEGQLFMYRYSYSGASSGLFPKLHSDSLQFIRGWYDHSVPASQDIFSNIINTIILKCVWQLCRHLVAAAQPVSSLWSTAYHNVLQCITASYFGAILKDRVSLFFDFSPLAKLLCLEKYFLHVLPS